MKLTHLLRRNLRFHRRGNFAVFLGVAVGTAVLTGALLVGDSLQGSLRDLTERRLGNVNKVMLPGRFFREIGEYFYAAPKLRVIVLQAGIQTERQGMVRRAQHVTAWGVNDSFITIASRSHEPKWFAQMMDRFMGRPVTMIEYDDGPLIYPFVEGQNATVSAALAALLAIKPGDTITLNVRKSSSVPRETLLGRRDAAEVLSSLKFKVGTILPENSLGSDFSLSPTQGAPQCVCASR